MQCFGKAKATGDQMLHMQFLPPMSPNLCLTRRCPRVAQMEKRVAEVSLAKEQLLREPGVQLNLSVQRIRQWHFKVRNVKSACRRVLHAKIVCSLHALAAKVQETRQAGRVKFLSLR